jgi:RND family efflux transporter MFP subunit
MTNTPALVDSPASPQQEPTEMSSDKPALDALRIDRSVSSRRPARPWLIPTILLALALAAVVGWLMTRPSPVAVETTTVRTQDTSSGSSPGRTVLNASGYVTARRSATVSSKVTGKVVEVLVEEGMKVEVGQVLARLDSSNVEASLRLAEAQLERSTKLMEETQPNLDFAQRELKRFTTLADTKIVSDSDLRRAEMEARALEARLARQKSEVAVAERELAQWRQQLDDTIIRAPFPGIVTSKNAQPGEMISPMSVGGFTRTGICTIVDMSSLEIEVDVNESYINRVQPGRAVEAVLDAYADWHIPAKVIAIIPTADRQKATVKVRVGFDQLDPRILPEMGVKVAFRSSGEEKPSEKSVSDVIVPKTAVQSDNGRDIAWVVRGSSVERRAVTVAQSNGEEIVVGAGLTAGERVVIKSAQPLTDGIRVIEKKP